MFEEKEKKDYKKDGNKNVNLPFLVNLHNGDKKTSPYVWLTGK